jgi:D-xylose transport system substrate-binding protein
MKRLLLLVPLLLAACGQRATIADIASCQRELGRAEASAQNAQANQAAAERRIEGLERELAAARAEVGGRGGAPSKTAAAAPPEDEDLTAAPPPPTALPDKPGKQLKVGLSLPIREERWVKDKLTMLAEAKKRNINLLVQISENNPTKQLQQCEAMIAQGIKVLIVAPNDGRAAAAIVEKAAKAGVQVISYDRLIVDSPHDYYYLSFDNVKVGELQGEWLTKQVPKGNYVVLAGAPTDNNAKLFKQGAMKYIQPLIDKGDVKVVYDQACADWAPAEASKHCKEALDVSSGNVQAVLAPNDGTAGGCIEALSALALAGKVPVTGQDAEVAAAIRIVKGQQGMTVFKDTRMLGKAAMEMAEVLARGKPWDTGGRTISNGKRNVKAVLLTPYRVTKENLDELLINSGYLNRSAVYRQ